VSDGAPAQSAKRSAAVSALVARHVPITGWLRTYPREWLRPDLISGLTSWGVMVPVALAYAALAGVPPELGLVTAFTALAAYAVFGTSRHLKVTTSSTMAVMSASVVAGLVSGDPAAFLAYTAALAMIVGGILVVGGIAKLGFISDFLSKPVVTGFIFGLAITIIVGQVPKILGIPGVSGTLPDQVRQIIDSLPDTNPYTLVVGLATLVLILGLRRISRKIPGPLIALVLGILAVSVLGLGAHGVSVVGEVATGVPSPSIPIVPVSAIPFLMLGAAGIVFLAVGESVGAGRAFAVRHGYDIEPDQELIALGAANLASGLFGGFSADASLSQTATAEDAGAASQLSSLVTSALVLATALFLAPLFKNLPNAVLGAIVIAGVISLMDAAEMRRYWSWRRTDFLIAVTAMVGVLLTTVMVGMLVAVMLSIVFMLYRASRPNVAALGRMPGVRAGFGDLSRHPNAEPIPGLVIVRLDAPLYYFNANVAKTQILALVAARQPQPRAVMIDIAATADLDVTTADMLLELVANLQARSIDLMLAQVKGPVRDRMSRTGLMAAIGEDGVHLSVGSGVKEFERRQSAGSLAAQDDAVVPADHGDATEPEDATGAVAEPEATSGPVGHPPDGGAATGPAAADPGAPDTRP
jgi:SulP family sulfate permease